MGRWGGGLRPAFGLIGALIATLVATQSVLANGSCSPSGTPGGNGGPASQGRNGTSFDPNSSFNGWYRVVCTNCIGAVGASLGVENPYVKHVASGADTDSVWVGLLKTNAKNLAQVGWLTYADPNIPLGNSTQIGFTEQNDSNGNREFLHYWGRGTLNTGQIVPGNLVVYTPGQNDTFTFYGGGNWVDSSTADFVPDSAENFSEIHTIASAMPGTLHDGGQQFQSVQVWTGTPGYSGSWGAFNGTDAQQNGSGNGILPGTYWGYGYPVPDHWWGWDKACS